MCHLHRVQKTRQHYLCDLLLRHTEFWRSAPLKPLELQKLKKVVSGDDPTFARDWQLGI